MQDFAFLPFTEDGNLALAAIAPFIAIGFIAQLIDGALGMAFGVISQTLLVSVGVPPAAASASVHLVEVFTTGASGASHIVHGNVDWQLFKRLVPFGVAGGVIGAYLLSNIDASAARPFVMAYLAIIGVYLLYRAIKAAEPRFEDPKTTPPTGACWRLPRCGGRRRLGPGCDLQPAGSGRRTAQGNRNGQQCRVPACAISVGRFHSVARICRVHRCDGWPDSRRRARCTARSDPRQADTSAPCLRRCVRRFDSNQSLRDHHGARLTREAQNCL